MKKHIILMEVEENLINLSIRIAEALLESDATDEQKEEVAARLHHIKSHLDLNSNHMDSRAVLKKFTSHHCESQLAKVQTSTEG